MKLTEVVVGLLAAIGAFTVAAVAGLAAWIWQADRSERARKRRHRDERIAQIVNAESPEGVTLGGSGWPGFLFDHNLNGRTPKEWRRP